ncbi:MAG: transposase [Verrucomicrobia bacterium]|nr:transposase [Verrucomicrobiota bacterium]
MPQSLARLLVHLIFSTKDRVPILTGEALRRDLHAYLAATARDLGCPAIRVGGVADHVHVVCCLARSVSVATLVAKLKVSSGQMLRVKAGKRFQWQNGYGAFSVSESALGSVVDYVANQDLHHRRLSFQDEYRAFLRRHGVEFDERYVWD